MPTPVVSEFVFYEELIPNKIGASKVDLPKDTAWFHPVGFTCSVDKYYVGSGWSYSIKCHECNKILGKGFSQKVILFTSPIYEQRDRGVTFYSVYDGDTSRQYCGKCADIMEIAPKL